MSDKPRPWPTQAMWARDGAAEALCAAIRQLEPLVGGRVMTESERLRRAALALAELQKALRLLVQVGARARME